MRFGLQDIKKHVQRRGDTLSVSLHFLRSGELRGEIERLVIYHEQMLGSAQRDFSVDYARSCIGDYRLAHCLLATLSAWYNWRQPEWQTVLQRLDDNLFECFQEAGITSPVQLRLALYNFVNEHYHGFLDAITRVGALEQFAEICSGKDEGVKHTLSVAELEYLLALDSDEEALLVRDAPHPPGANQVAALYNQWVFEAALFNASNVHFVIDCNAFMEMQDTGPNTPATGVGAVIKRLCYLARKLGVYYDLAYESASGAGQIAPSILHLTLFGPQEMTGAPQQYGIRLVKLARILLGYSTPKRSNTLPASAILKAEATVHFLQRTYRFVIDAKLLDLLPSETSLIETPPSASSTSSSSNEQIRESSSAYQIATSIYDSSIEQTFAEAFQALANSNGADGWRLEREPEPILLTFPSTETASSAALQGLFIPDFALTRDNLRIYVEILGFWTPSYRERKIAKLQLLKDRNDIVLAIPRESSEAFASLSTDFPLIIYDGQLSATELLKVLRLHYDDLASRLAQIDVDSVRKRIRSDGLLPERACYALLHCYRRSEMQKAAEHIQSEDIAFAPGIGFYEIHSLEHLRNSFVEWLEQKTTGSSAIEGSDPGNLLPLPWVIQESRSHWPILATCEDATIEALISLWPEVYISRSSIFEATIALSNGRETPLPQVEAAPKRLARTQRTSAKKRIIRETSQPDLWN